MSSRSYNNLEEGAGAVPDGSENPLPLCHLRSELLCPKAEEDQEEGEKSAKDCAKGGS